MPSTQGQLLARKNSSRPAISGSSPIAVNNRPVPASFRPVRRSWRSGSLGGLEGSCTAPGLSPPPAAGSPDPA
jgi:hypothetical protein